MTQSWELELAMIRQRAAALCGLAEYPGELIRITERLDAPGAPFRSPAQWERFKRRQAVLLERLPGAGQTGGSDAGEGTAAARCGGAPPPDVKSPEEQRLSTGLPVRIPAGSFLG